MSGSRLFSRVAENTKDVIITTCPIENKYREKTTFLLLLGNLVAASVASKGMSGEGLGALCTTF